jgi:dsDNA-specific endonuclease/ATPase MutS2
MFPYLSTFSSLVGNAVEILEDEDEDEDDSATLVTR